MHVKRNVDMNLNGYRRVMLYRIEDRVEKEKIMAPIAEKASKQNIGKSTPQYEGI